MMNIAAMLELEHGVSRLKFGGILQYVKKPSIVTGTTKQSESFSYYTQFLIIDDGSAGVPVVLNIGADTDKALTIADRGKAIKCWSGKIERYTKDGENKMHVCAYGELVGAIVECDPPKPETVEASITVEHLGLTNEKQAHRFAKRVLLDEVKQQIPLIENANLCAAIVAAGWLMSGRNLKTAKEEIPGLVKLFLDTGLPF